MKMIEQVPMRKGYRKIHLPDGIWQYQIVRSHVNIIAPSGMRHNTDESQVTGMSWSDLERGYWKKWGSMMGIKPAQIRDWIVNNLQRRGTKK